MAGKVHILESDVANKIAAGEVIQRPASAVKELIENSIDAGAMSIDVLVKDAGKTLLQVVDDGEGMSEADAALAFRRHATSKISSARDLERIETLGFRGEALASIASIAHVELRTRTADDELGTLLKVEGSAQRGSSKVACGVGTTVMVRNLFFNTPARRAFMKSRATELRNISDAVTRMALIYPEISWKYRSDDDLLIDVVQQDQADRVRSILGEKHFSYLVPVSERTEYLTLSGFIGRPSFVRKNRAEQYLYLNRRYIQNRAINHAVFQAYEHLLVKGSFPFFLLNLTIEPSKVDVNVHPSKLEVKFENESDIYRFVLSVLKRTLAAHDLVPSVSLSTMSGGQGGGQGPLEIISSFDEAVRRGGDAVTTRAADSFLRREELDNLFGRADRGSGAASSVPAGKEGRIFAHETPEPGSTGDREYPVRSIWQIHDKYIISQVKTGLMIVDQHVAHERILYERAVQNLENALPSSQQLLFPQTVALSPTEYALVKEILPDLRKLGFDLKLFGKNTVVIEGIPSDVRVGNEGRILLDLLDEIQRNEHNAKIDARDNLAKSFACKAAIKAGDKLKPDEMINLIDHLFATKMPYVCPHGRPVVLKITLDELDKRFGRT